MNTSDILNRAADLIEDRGLWKGGNEDGTCAANAISHEARHLAGRARLAVLDAFVVHVGAASGASLSVIWDWNDAPERTKAEVVAALRACAVIEATREREAVSV